MFNAYYSKTVVDYYFVLLINRVSFLLASDKNSVSLFKVIKLVFFLNFLNFKKIFLKKKYIPDK